MADRLDEIRARADAATPGPWHRPRSGQRDRLVLTRLAVGRGHLALVGCRPSGERYAPEGDHARFGEANAAFIAAARSDIPYLLDRLGASEQEAARLREALRAVVDSVEVSDDEEEISVGRAAIWAAQEALGRRQGGSGRCYRVTRPPAWIVGIRSHSATTP
jgi:hypothetical protein